MADDLNQADLYTALKFRAAQRFPNDDPVEGVRKLFREQPDLAERYEHAPPAPRRRVPVAKRAEPNPEEQAVVDMVHERAEAIRKAEGIGAWVAYLQARRELAPEAERRLMGAQG